MLNQKHNNHVCCECGMGFRNSIFLDRHMKQRHARDQLHKCPACCMGFRRWSDVKKHMQTHTDEKPHVCSDCGKRFSSVAILKEHMMLHQAKEVVNLFLLQNVDKLHDCIICGKQVFNIELHLKTHLKMSTNVCRDCGKGFNLSTELKSHMLSHNPDYYPICSHCGMGFFRLEDLQEHMEKPHMCLVCYEGFTSPTDLDVHKLTHKVGKWHECWECGKVYMNFHHFWDHIPTHRRDRRYVCSECGKAYKTTHGMRLHMRSHTEHCLYCGKHKRQLGVRDMHMQQPGDKPYVCCACGKDFRHQDFLKTHLLKHRKKFPCPQCPQSFVQASTLDKHLLKHAKEIDEFRYVCSDCGKRFKKSTSLDNHLKTHTAKLSDVLPVVSGMDLVPLVSSGRDLDLPENIVHVLMISIPNGDSCGDLTNIKFQSIYEKCDTCVGGFVNVRELQYHIKCHNV